MAELTNLDEKLAEVLGLAMAAQGATTKIKKLAQDQARLTKMLDRMAKEAAETEKRCVKVASARDGKKSKIMTKARETKKEATQMMSTYLGRGSDALDGFEFLTMAEAGEVGHWAIVQTMAQKAGDADVMALAQWALPIQQRHFEEANAGALRLAQAEDPNESA